jgi:hypothetical protein
MFCLFILIILICFSFQRKLKQNLDAVEATDEREGKPRKEKQQKELLDRL